MKEAKQTISHYFRILFEKHQIVWTAEHQAEIESAIDSIVEESKKESK